MSHIDHRVNQPVPKKLVEKISGISDLSYAHFTLLFGTYFMIWKYAYDYNDIYVHWFIFQPLVYWYALLVHDVSTKSVFL